MIDTTSPLSRPAVPISDGPIWNRDNLTVLSTSESKTGVPYFFFLSGFIIRHHHDYTSNTPPCLFILPSSILLSLFPPPIYYLPNYALTLSLTNTEVPDTDYSPYISIGDPPGFKSIVHGTTIQTTLKIIRSKQTTGYASLFSFSRIQTVGTVMSLETQYKAPSLKFIRFLILSINITYSSPTVP